jgi:hypothetical protein
LAGLILCDANELSRELGFDLLAFGDGKVLVLDVLFINVGSFFPDPPQQVLGFDEEGIPDSGHG